MSEDSEKTIRSQGANFADSEATIKDDSSVYRRRAKAGDVLLGRYEVLSELGQGGMGVVYHCLDKTGRVEVAVKALPPELSHSASEMEEVRENYGLVSALVHQNIAACRTLEADPASGDYYLVMEYVDGESLKQWARRKRKDGSLTLESVLPVLQQIADALDYAHGQKIMHRDVKPGNVMVKSDGTVKVLDFGLAAQIRSSLSHVSMAYASRSGTSLYKSPEQWRGQPQGAATDQYALAATAYELLSGHVPFEDDNLDVLSHAVLTVEPAPVEGLPKYANDALLHGLAKEPSKRYPTCADFVKTLGGEKVSLGGIRVKLQINWMKVVAIAAIVVVLAMVGVVYNRHAETKRIETEKSLITRRAELEVELERLLREINGMKLERGQTFGKHLDDFAKHLEIGKRAGADEPEIAVKNFEVALKEGEWILKNAPLRDQATVLLNKVNSARTEAKNTKADKYASEIYKMAFATENEGVKAYENGEFETALEKLKVVPDHYLDAQTKTIVKRIEYLKAKADEARKQRDWEMLEARAEEIRQFSVDEYNMLVKEAWEGRIADAIEKELVVARKAMDEKKWEEAIAHANEALKIKAGHAEALKLKAVSEKSMKVANELISARKSLQAEKWSEALAHVENALKLELKNEEAKELKTEIENSWPRISIKATVDGREVEAMLCGTEKMTPLTGNQLEKAKTITGKLITLQGRDIYVGSFDEVVNWHGLKEVIIDLKKLEGKIVLLPNNEILEMVEIKAGNFTIGSPEMEKDRYRDETQHRVTLTQDYWLGKYEVTQGQWKAIMGNNPSFYKKGDDYPVEKVDWNEAMAFCRRLTEIERSAGRLPNSYEYTLPTEAQWEYASRGGHKSNGYHVYSGSDNLDGVGWYDNNSGSSTHPVGQKRANELGLHDMSGNVDEWCHDWYDTNTYKSGSSTNPVGPPNGSSRVLRGGSWGDNAESCRSAHRSKVGPTGCGNDVGFRVALVPVQ